MLFVDRDHVELRGRLIENRRPRPAPILCDGGAAVVALEDDLRIVWVEPQTVHVAVWHRHDLERPASIARLPEILGADPHLLRIRGIDVDVMEVERSIAWPCLVVDQPPRLA